MNTRSLAYVAVRLLALYFFITAIVHVSNVVQVSLPNLMSIKDAAVSRPDQIVLLVVVLLPSIIMLLSAFVLWTAAYRISGLLTPAVPPREEAAAAEASEREELPRRSRSQELAALTKPLLQTGLGISGLILLINGIPDFIHMLMTITYVDTHMYPDHMQRELSANFVQVIVKMLLGLCLAIGAGGLTRYFTRSSSS
ncbi:hypothetical protein M5W83_24105 [Paenibacillus thiaminolyticus]|uniref:Uncharacterized protein n=1 Tax=Paenibacillus thiaminolyticus TaxID=49283 RepID=A0AAP9DSQ5_PANTH|nr:hypothetical protein [Paenibacillus thiaminolyticus]MCY9536475.1 hypothetical protein [Paenibacillus thiaminolyticus]MCY9601487.1 hypothetical protein [Paenibacillus thiaminolyticus]MCY9610235.1 hypothetical protein [Paenibacillus thiaminolyticus]MCY9616515.1 hypothetical protein [Paenibacillus thiaminolyticus]MCY9616873.1 hypothetical protein [Paenibacillus thiaminolyticus]